MAHGTVVTTSYEYLITCNRPLAITFSPFTPLEPSSKGDAKKGGAATEAFETGAHAGFIACFLLIMGCGVMIAVCKGSEDSKT